MATKLVPKKSTEPDEAWEERIGNQHWAFVRRGDLTVKERIPLQHTQNIDYLRGVAKRLKQQLDDSEKGAVPIRMNRASRRQANAKNPRQFKELMKQSRRKKNHESKRSDDVSRASGETEVCDRNGSEPGQ